MDEGKALSDEDARKLREGVSIINSILNTQPGTGATASASGTSHIQRDGKFVIPVAEL